MRKFNKRLLLFILPIMLLAYPADLLLSSIVQNSNLYYGESEVWDDIYESNIEAEIAVYGSSRAWGHFNPKIFEEKLGRSAYNFGMDGHNFCLQNLRHEEYFKHNPHPNTIIYSIGTLTLAKRVDLFNKNQFLPSMLFNANVYEHTKSYQGFSKADYFVPLIRYSTNLEFSDLLSDTIFNEYRYKGYKGKERQWNSDLAKARKQFPNYRIDLDSASIRQFKTFIGEIQNEGIELILVYSPEYIEGQSLIKNRAEIIGYMEAIAQNYNLPFYDYSDSVICTNRELFYNTLHLNTEGADRFTNKFIEDWQLKK